jgi:multicomponent Na+:H+ antiporter subunit F
MIWLYLFGIAAALVSVRLLKGPTTGDRLLAINILAGFAVMFTLYYSIATGNQLLLDIGLVIAALSFTGMLGLVKWIGPRPEGNQ